MSLADCLNTAVQGGELKPEIAAKVAKEYEAQVQDYLTKGLAPAEAERAAADDIINRVTEKVRARRHATLHQLRVMQDNQARYGTEPWNNPRLILRDMQQLSDSMRGIERELFGYMQDFLRAFHTDITGGPRNKALQREVAMELHGQDSGNRMAKEIAEATRATFEMARARANSLGMDIGKLEDWGLPHMHHAERVKAAGFDAWFAELYDGRRLDWSRSINPKTGKPYVVKAGARPLRHEAEEFLQAKFATISTAGRAFEEPSMAFKGTSFAGRHSKHRSLHFLTGDDWWQYNEKFGTASVFDTTVNHIKGMARDIALMQRFGPNPTLGLEHATQVIRHALDHAPADVPRWRIKTAETVITVAKTDLKLLTGEANVARSETLAQVSSGYREIKASANLGSAALWAIFDQPNAAVQALLIRQNPLSPFMQTIRSVAHEFNVGSLDKEDLKALGFQLQTWTDANATQARFAIDNVYASPLSRRISTTVFRGSLLNFISDNNKRGVQLAFSMGLGKWAGKPFDQLNRRIRAFMAHHEFTAADWDAMRAQVFRDRAGNRHINDKVFLAQTDLPPEQAQDVAARFGAMMERHVDYTMNTNNFRARAALHTQPGSAPDLFVGSFKLFKTYPIQMLLNQVNRAAWLGVGGTVELIALFGVANWLAGGVMLQIDEVSRGRDLRDMTEPTFWGEALIKGGGLGIFGDFLFSAVARNGRNMAETIMGPLFSDGAAVANVIGEVAQGDNAGSEALRLVRGFTPGANFQPPIPLPIKLAVDRIIFDQLELILDPEARQRMLQDMRKKSKERGNGYWWREGETAPERAPRFSTAFGGQP